jgi:hypothetical protein
MIFAHFVMETLSFQLTSYSCDATAIIAIKCVAGGTKSPQVVTTTTAFLDSLTGVAARKAEIKRVSHTIEEVLVCDKRWKYFTSPQFLNDFSTSLLILE